MKKLLTILLALLASVCAALAFTACDIDDLFKPDKGGSQPVGERYNVTVADTDNFLHEPLKDKYRVGTEVEIKIDMVTDIGVYVFVNDERINQSGWDNDNYYIIYKFTMPEEDVEVYITTNAYHGVDICDFSRPFYWANYLKDDEVVKIKRESSCDGSPENVEIKYTTDKTDIENICAVFNCKLKPCANPQITGSYFTTYTFYTADSEYELKISGGYAVEITFSTSYWFEIVGFNMPEIANPSVD